MFVCFQGIHVLCDAFCSPLLLRPMLEKNVEDSTTSETYLDVA